MSSRSMQRALTSQFMAVTGANEKVAGRMLKCAGWKLEQACDSYFTGGTSAAPPSKDRENLEKLFESYRLPTDDAKTTSVDGTMKYLGDLGVNLENAEMLVPLEIIQSQSFGEMERDSFVNGWKAVGADTIAKQKVYVAGQIKELSTDMNLFKKVYRHAFLATKERSQKALPLENAITFWGLLFSPPGKEWTTATTDWFALWSEFLTAKFTKTVNKDMWNQTFEFMQKTLKDETLGFWSEDGAWPSVIDDFVAYAKTKRGDVPEAMETD